MIVAHYRHRHHAKRDHSVTEIVPTDKLPRTGIGNCGHRPSDLIFSKWPRRGCVWPSANVPAAYAVDTD